MPIVEEVMHFGIPHLADTEETAVAYNIQKARRTVYSLMGLGLHGENCLDPETPIHLLQIYVLPILVYGMEVVLPKATLIEKLERNIRISSSRFCHFGSQWPPWQYMFCLVSFQNEAVIHKKTLMLFGSACRLGEDSFEKQVARRQLCVKSFDSNS